MFEALKNLKMTLLRQYCKHILKNISLLTIIFLLSGCHRTVCPGYPEEYLNWMPYKSGDNASFTDGKNTIELFVNETYRSGDYKQHKVWNMEFPCDMDARVILSGASNPNQILINREKRDIPDESGIFYNYALSFFGNDW